MAGIHSGFVVALSTLLVMHVCFSSGQDTGVEILIAPVTQRVVAGGTAKFSCKARGQFVFWKVNGTTVQNFNPSSDLIDRGFIFYDAVMQGETILNMTVDALPKNNNTNIQCSASLDSEDDRSDPAWLIVIGAPNPDSLHLSTEMINATSVLVTWTTPYIPPENELLYYSVKVENGTTSMDIHFETVDAEETNVTYVLETLTSGRSRQARRCDNFTFTVTAHTLLGNSTIAVTSRYFPIAPGQFRSQPEVSVTFGSDLPTVTVRFQLPDMCPDQELQYTITIQNTDRSTSFEIGPKNITYTSEMIEEEIANGMLSDDDYNLVVYLSTIAGNSTSDTVQFHAITIIPTTSGTEALCPDPPALVNGMVTFTGNSVGDTATYACNPGFQLIGSSNATCMQVDVNTAAFSPVPPVCRTDDSGSSTFYLIVGIVAGAIIGALLLLIVAVTIVLICIHTRRNRAYISSKGPPPMVTNPLYEGPLYETIGTPQFTSLSALNLTTPQESPYAHIQQQQYSNQTSQNGVDGNRSYMNVNAAMHEVVPSSVRSEDNYTLMNPARVVTNPKTENVENPEPKRTEVIRYVQSEC